MLTNLSTRRVSFRKKLHAVTPKKINMLTNIEDALAASVGIQKCFSRPHLTLDQLESRGPLINYFIRKYRSRSKRPVFSELKQLLK